MNERLIQNILYRYALSLAHNHLCPNVYVYSWESDFLSVTKAGLVHEYEIKVAVSDFRADAQKTDKHSTLSNGWRELSEWEKRFIDHAVFREKLTPELKLVLPRPNYFWYVCPENLIRESDVPKYAGLIYVRDGCSYPIAFPKCAPRIHRDKIEHDQSKHIVTSLGHKYWRLRMAKTEEYGDVKTNVQQPQPENAAALAE